jgi:hypothetical protein
MYIYTYIHTFIHTFIEHLLGANALGKGPIGE